MDIPMWIRLVGGMLGVVALAVAVYLVGSGKFKVPLENTSKEEVRKLVDDFESAATKEDKIKVIKKLLPFVPPSHGGIIYEGEIYLKNAQEREPFMTVRELLNHWVSLRG